MRESATDDGGRDQAIHEITEQLAHARFGGTWLDVPRQRKGLPGIPQVRPAETGFSGTGLSGGGLPPHCSTELPSSAAETPSAGNVVDAVIDAIQSGVLWDPARVQVQIAHIEVVTNQPVAPRPRLQGNREPAAPRPRKQHDYQRLVHRLAGLNQPSRRLPRNEALAITLSSVAATATAFLLFTVLKHFTLSP